VAEGTTVRETSGETERSSPPRPGVASPWETARLFAQVLLPTLTAGVIKRRPLGMRVAERLDVDGAANRFIGRLRDRHGGGPLRLRVPGRSLALVLSGADSGRLLYEVPEPFTPSTTEKKAALRHFQPHGVLISEAGKRDARRPFNEAVLEFHQPLHSLAPSIARVLRDEVGRIPVEALRDGLDWKLFDAHWQAAVRSVVLGEGARHDRELTAMLDTLRRRANWAYLLPRKDGTRARFDERLRSHLERAEGGTLAAAVAAVPESEGADREGQVPHWLFAFDAAGIATYRALALLASHPEEQRQALEDVTAADLERPNQLEYMRACVLESVRLWPTTPLLLRQSTTATEWASGGFRRDTSFVIYTPFLHRDRTCVPAADEFRPEMWLDGTAQRTPALVPFSAGPAQCPARNLVLFMTSTALAVMFEHHRYELEDHRLRPGAPVPPTFDNFSTRFTVRRDS